MRETIADRRRLSHGSSDDENDDNNDDGDEEENDKTRCFGEESDDNQNGKEEEEDEARFLQRQLMLQAKNIKNLDSAATITPRRPGHEGRDQWRSKFTRSNVTDRTLFPNPHVIDGPVETAMFENPYGIACDAEGNVYVADTNHHRIRRIKRGSSVVETIAGNTNYTAFGEFAAGGYLDGKGIGTKFDSPRGLAVAPDNHLIIADETNCVIRRMNLKTLEVTTLAGLGDNQPGGCIDGRGTEAFFYDPSHVAVDSKGNVYVTCRHAENRVRKILPNGDVQHFCGRTNIAQAGSRDGSSTHAAFFQPMGLAIDAEDNVFIADMANNRVRSASPAGEVFTVAGPSNLGGSTTGSPGISDGPALGGAKFNYPQALAVDHHGNLYVADTESDRIRKIVRANRICDPK
eukprot:jgi/Bigna1/129171/aug1.8_g3879